MKRLFRAALLGAAVFLLAGCATTTGHPQPGQLSGASGSDLESLRRHQERLNRQVEQLQDNLLLLEARVHDQRELLEETRAAMKAEKVTAAGEKTDAPPPPHAPTAPDVFSQAPASPTETYLQAFSDYASGSFAQAIFGFESFLHYFPDNDYAANAQYWLGECYLAQQQYAQAAEAFQKTFSRYPQGAKTPDALLKLADAFEAMHQQDRAAAALQTLRQRYPNSAAARQSEQER